MMNNDQAGQAYQFANSSRVGQMLWIGFYTLVLNLLTLTLFRFWGRTHFRRQLWSDTTIDGEALEYTGRGKELFIGFLIAIFTVMLPTVGLVFAAQLLLGDEIAVIAIIIVYIFILWLAGVAIFLARRYMVSRTRYRGIRFEQRGSATDYGWRAFGFGILTGLTLGWYAPAARLRLSRYMWSNAYFGSERVKFEDTESAMKEPVYGSFAFVWVGGIALYIGLIAFLQRSNIMEGVAYGDPMALAKLYGAFFLFALCMTVVTAWYQAVMTRRIIKSISLNGSRATCNLDALQLFNVWFVGAIFTVITLGAGLLAARMMAWRLIANHTSLVGEIDFDSIAQAASTGPSQGEGIADGLDLGAGF